MTALAHVPWVMWAVLALAVAANVAIDWMRR